MIPARPIPRVAAPSIERYRRDYERTRTPVVVTGALEGRPALATWSLDHLAAHGDVPVRVRMSRRGERQLFDGDSGAAFDFGEMPLRAAVAHLREPGGDVWYVQHGDLRKMPRLAAEIGPLPYVPRRHQARALLWVSGPGTVNPLHWDTNHVLLAQITGEKTFVLFPPEDSKKLASFSHRTIWRTTGLDLGDIDRARFPDVDRATAWSATVRPGEILFIPYRFWHYMRCDGGSISVTWWWSPSLATHLRDTARDHAAGFVQRRLRALRAREGRRRAPTGA